MCWVQLCPRLAQHALGLDSFWLYGFSPFIVVFAIGLLRRFLYPILDLGGLSIHWILCGTPFTRVTFLYMAFSKTLAYTPMLWFKLKP